MTQEGRAISRSSPGRRGRVRVGIDATAWSNPRGFGRFTRNTVTRIVRSDSDSDYVLYVNAGSYPEDLPEAGLRREVPLRHMPSASFPRGATRRPADLVRLSWAASRDGLDVFLFPSLLTYFPVFGMPTVVGMYDATAVTHTDLVLPSRQAQAFWFAKQTWAVRRATYLFTNAESARRDVIGHLHVPARRVVVVPAAPATVFYPRDDREQLSVLAHLGVPPQQPLFVYGAGINPHKNLGTLIDAFARVRSLYAEPITLIVAGDPDRSYIPAGPAVRQHIARLGLEEAIKMPGFLPDDMLATLYSAATAAVIPSLAEGFGLPAVEAARCGAAVILSDLPAHRETLGDAALYFPPNDVSALVRSMLCVMEDPTFRQDLARRAQQAVSNLSWEAAAEGLHSLIMRALRENRSDRE
jgi:glycosyltransferase involved in cell wall biosynthesis